MKHGLLTVNYRLRTGNKIRTRYKTRTVDCGLGIKYGLWTTLVKTVLIALGKNKAKRLLNSKTHGFKL